MRKHTFQVTRGFGRVQAGEPEGTEIDLDNIVEGSVKAREGGAQFFYDYGKGRTPGRIEVADSIEAVEAAISGTVLEASSDTVEKTKAKDKPAKGSEKKAAEKPAEPEPENNEETSEDKETEKTEGA